MTTYRKIADERNDVEMMKSPSLWPAWPFLPVKREGKEVGDWPECAVLFDGAKEQCEFTVFHANMYSGIDADTKTTKYASWEDVAAAGWIVD